MNWLGFGTVFLAFAAYVLGLLIGKRAHISGALLLTAALLLAVPAIVYDLYYLKIFGEPIWLYRLRTIPGSELLAVPSGVLAGLIQSRLVPHLRLSPIGKRILVPLVFALAVSFPWLKPLLRPLGPSTWRSEWKNGACLQSTASTCGPAAAAAIVRRLGGDLTEGELARRSFTSKSSTENWYLARALRRHGYTTQFLKSDPAAVPLPAIAGVRLRSLGRSGHFIALLERRGDALVVADPMEGFLTNTLADLKGPYEFTGFFLVIQPQSKSAPLHRP
jgi:Peptidase C39 family